MIPALGVMIGFYINMRMLEMLSMKDKPTWLQVAAAITIAVTVIAMIDILNAGSNSRF